MDYGYIDPCRYEVRIAGENNKLIGSGVLFVPCNSMYAYVFTAAHLFWFVDDLGKEYTPSEKKLSLSFAANRTQSISINTYICKAPGTDEYGQQGSLVLLHDKYDPKSKRWDAAVLRIACEPWMKTEMKAFHFPSSYVDMTLSGWGYPETTSETEGWQSDMFDSFRESLPIEGNAEKYDAIYQDIQFHYNGIRGRFDLDGFSGTGFFSESNMFFGVLSRDVGNEFSGSYVWLTAWSAFGHILDTCGNVSYKQYIDSAKYERICLNVQAWWLQETMYLQECGLMDDRYSINLQTILLGMTDPYVVILASVWRGGIGKELEKQLDQYVSEHMWNSSKKPRQQWIEYDECFPDYKISLAPEDGVVINISSDSKKMYEISQQVLKILYQRETMVGRHKLVINIYSANPEIAFHALQRIHEEKASEDGIDFLSAISYSMLAWQENETVSQGADRAKEHMRYLKLSDIRNELMRIKDEKTAVWWKVLKGMAGSGEQEEVLLGFQIAKSYHPAVECWIRGLNIRWFEKWRKHPEELADKLSTEDIDLLCWELYLYQKKSMEDRAKRCGELLCGLKKYGSPSVVYFWDMEPCNEGTMYSENTLMHPEEVVRWARNAGEEEFQKALPQLKTNKAYYWSAIVNSSYGLEYVLTELFEQERNTYVEKILNQRISGGNDIYQDEDVEYLRSIIRRRRKG